jgi:hypothetical protein
MTNKTCTRCGASKSLSDFSGHPKAADGKQSQCKQCAAERARLKRLGRPCETCKAPLSPDAKKWARVCDKCLQVCTQCGSAPRIAGQRICAACQAESDRERKSPPEAKFRERMTRVRGKYGVRPALAAALSAFYQCEACGKTQTRSGEMHVDHCHETGAVRGVLCFNCNAALGHVGDSPERLRKLIAYLETKEPFQSLGDLQKTQHYIDLLLELERRAHAQLVDTIVEAGPKA